MQETRILVYIPTVIYNRIPGEIHKQISGWVRGVWISERAPGENLSGISEEISEEFFGRLHGEI